MSKQTRLGKIRDQNRLAKDELKEPVTFKHESIILTFAVSMALEVFEASVKTLLGVKFWKRLGNESKRNKIHPLGYAFNLVNK